MLLYNPSYEICALLFLTMLAIFFFSKENLHTLTNRLYGIFVIIVMIDLAMDITSTFTLTYADSVPQWINHAINSVYYFAQVSMAMMFMLYAMALTDTLHKDRWRQLLLFSLPLAIVFVLVSTNFLTGLLFYFDGAGQYHHGAAFMYMYVAVFFYLIAGLIYVGRYQNRISYRQYYIILLYALVLLLAILFQFFYPRELVVGAGMALALFAMYMTYQNPDDHLDKLTSLYGRTAFLIVLDQVLHKRHNDYHIVVVDLNDFKSINNLFGLKGGDELILQIAKYLTDTCKKRRSLFRVAGDRFALLLPGRDAHEMVERLQERFRQTWAVGNSDVRVTATICKLNVSRMAANNEEIIFYLENALQLAKREGRGRYVDVDKQLVAQLSRRLLIEKSLRRLDEYDCLRVFFQPIYAAKGERCIGAEALLRMETPELGLVMPDEFIPVAEQTGLIVDVGRRMMTKTCAFITANHLDSLGVEMVDINLSAIECMAANTATQIRNILRAHPPGNTRINLEITESTAVASENRLHALMEQVSALGATFSLDDYGQGYANAETVLRYPFWAIKLDKDMLWSCADNERARIIYHHTVQMIREMGLIIVAEGAETAAQVDMLRTIGVDYIQGYYYSRPLPAPQFLALMQAQSASPAPAAD